MRLSIIFRSHDKSNLHGERYTGTAKDEVTYRCLYSLVQAVNYVSEADTAREYSIDFTVLDDHSSHPEIIRAILAEARCQTAFEPLLGTGNNDSMERYFVLGAQASEIVYLVEDDYLHDPVALWEMLRDYATFSRNLGSFVAMSPFNDPDNYHPQHITPSRLVQGVKRYWRTSEWTLATLFLHSDILRKHQDLFMKFARDYEKVPHVHEGTTFGTLWGKEVILFSPIPSLALHVQSERQKDPYIDWKAWWGSADYKTIQSHV